MIDYKERSSQKEFLDRENIPFADIAVNMKELAWINSHLGGHSISIRGFKELFNKSTPQSVSRPSFHKKSISVCEIGCGGGDNLNVLFNYCNKNNIDATFTGIDINQECISFAKEKSLIKNAQFIACDFKNVSFEIKPDIIFSSLFCHHFSDKELVETIGWMKENSIIGFFINDLHRHPIAYYFIKTASALFSKSYLVKNDAPLSVLRGFKRKDWHNILNKAGIQNFSIKWKWAFRYLIIVLNS